MLNQWYDKLLTKKLIITNSLQQDILLTPARIATSKPAQRTYLNTLLVTIASTILLGVAVLAYATFYWNYIPRTGVERVIHLQYKCVLVLFHYATSTRPDTNHQYIVADQTHMVSQACRMNWFNNNNMTSH